MLCKLPDDQLVGFYDIEVLNSNTNSWINLENCFEVQSFQPTVESVEPNNGSQGGVLDVSIYGYDFNFIDYSNSQYSTVNFIHSDYSDVSFSGTIWNSDSDFAHINVSIPDDANAGYYDVEVYDYGLNDWLVIENGFFVEIDINPVIESITPNSGFHGESLDVFISGSNFQFDNYF